MSIWASGSPYEAYVGRWSRAVARELLAWLGVPRERRWLDVGCGTGALSETILEEAAPGEVVGCDPSEGFLGYAAESIKDERISFQVADAQALPFEDGRFDAVVSGLVLNFVPDPRQGLAEMTRVARPGGVVAVRAIDVPTVFRDFDDYWAPFLGARGPAPSYVMSLDEEQRSRLRERIRSALTIAPNGSIPLIARAWAARGTAKSS